jgi:hypothetical protein
MLDAFVERVRAAYDATFPEHRALRGYGCAFHLKRCYCGAPTWQQPCPTCGYYPMYGTPGTSCKPDSATRERFAARARHFGGVAAWYFAGFRQVVAYAEDPAFRDRIDRLVVDAATWTNVPTPEEVWDAVRGEPPTGG